MENKISLFDTNIPPLAERVRPKSLKEFIGQSHILGENKILNSLIENMKLFSMILWGPPGSGKTTLARLLTIKSNYELHQISAVSSGVKDLRQSGGMSLGPGTEKSDSIPAMLSDGEFVMTSRAVRGIGDGSRKLGAKRLYNMMHKAENNVSV